MATTRRLKDLVAETLPRLQLPEGTVTVALSGGADSATLALLARETRSDVTALHIDHQLPASPLMAETARAIANRLTMSIETVQVTLSDEPSPEARARNARYRVLVERGRPVLTGHTRDDSVETMLINMLRGTGTTGLTGIPRFRPPNIYRPMLDVSRAVTREIASLGGLPFDDDPMNEDMSLTRNRIRLELLPLMRELNPQVDAALTRAMTGVERDSDYLDGLASDLEIAFPLPTSVLTTLPRVVADRVLRRALVDSGIGPTADRIERLWSVATGERERQDLADGRVVVRRGVMLVIE